MRPGLIICFFFAFEQENKEQVYTIVQINLVYVDSLFFLSGSLFSLNNPD